jgi:formamidopyrimidine-DNA glycosylase
MPELPEVEHLRRSLDPVIVGATVRGVRVVRRDVVHATAPSRTAAQRQTALLVGERLARTSRRGKQLAIEAESGMTLVIQLGMTGSVTIERGRPPSGMDGKHRHVVWELDLADGRSRVRMAFRDPRRFGGITTYPSRAHLDQAWESLGPDGLGLTATELSEGLRGRKRPGKSALLDQSVVAGVGNIYADESLFASAIHPQTQAGALSTHQIGRLAAEIRRILNHAADAGGSTLRDYRDAFGNPGGAVQLHMVYGRGGEPCLRCGTTLLGLRLQGRATVCCPRCQDLSTGRAGSRSRRRS